MNIARHIDHTLLKAEATEADIRRLVAEAIEHRFASVCVNGRWVALAAGLLHEAGADVGDDAVKVCAVVGFPLGAMKGVQKSMEAVSAVKDGAREIDMVVPLNLMLEGKEEELRGEIGHLVHTATLARAEVIVKVILETAALTEEQAALGCRAARAARAHFVKTSTGFHPKGGATLEAVGWLVRHGAGMQVKASGGIKDRATAEAMLAAGAARLGTSSGVAIVRGQTGHSAY